MKEALIGHTGFVGSNLQDQHTFTHLYNSKNFKEISKNKYDRMVCAGVSSTKWLANKNPEEDLLKIQELQSVLQTIEVKEFVLISTIDVYPDVQYKDEDYDCHNSPNHSYGKHRLMFEDFCSSKFNNCLIVRLPGLFGEGIKKNIIYDLINDNCIETINPKSSFQYYCLDMLWKDILKIIKCGLKKINLCTEPIHTYDILTLIPKKVATLPQPEVHYDLYTKYASYWNKDGHYIYTKDEIMNRLLLFIQNQRVLQ